MADPRVHYSGADYHSDEVACCRGCGKVLDGKAYCFGGSAYDPVTRKAAKVNTYGGYVCSRSCDQKASLWQEQSMPGNGRQVRLSSQTALEIKRRWRDEG